MDGLYVFLYTYIFFFGCLVGSLVNMLALRWAREGAFLICRPYCPSCGKSLKLWHQIPLLGFLFLRGRCAFCHRQIPARYPFVELFCGLLFVLCFWVLGFHLLAANLCLVAALLLCVFLLDRESKRIPNTLVAAFLVPSGVELLLTHWTGVGIGLGERVLGLCALSVPLCLLSLWRKGAFGGGDIKLSAVCGFLLGARAILLAGALAFLSAGLVLGLRFLVKRVRKSDRVPFGPYLAVAIFMAKLCYTGILSWYLV